MALLWNILVLVAAAIALKAFMDERMARFRFFVLLVGLFTALAQGWIG